MCSRNNSICSHNSLTFRDRQNEDFPAIKPPSQRPITVIKLLSSALQKKTYVLTMVDPDAPKRSSSTSVYWRHWLVVNIQVHPPDCDCLFFSSDYHPPTPPQTSGLHRYQFMLFEQPPNTQVSLTHKESSRGKWDLQAFITRSGLGKPVATVQFLTQNYND
uniref:Phosphatidylethanolamine binding protein 4 n=1 Tax=Salarias fasciatus TaxID=181472 RepID=A0A672J5Y0_SALFA